MRLVTREEWGALPSKGSSGLFAPGWGDFLVVHYTGISARPDPTEFDQKADYLRGLQRYYQSGKHPNGPIRPDGTYAPFVDVGYNFACWNDDEPAIWELRGLRMRGGANGTASSNAVRPSCLIVADIDEPVNRAVAQKMAWLVQLIRDQSQRQTGTRGHRDEFPTGCPGDDIYPLVTSGAFLPENQAAPDPTPEPPTSEDDMTLYVTNREPRLHEGREFPAGAIIYAIDPFGKLRNVKPAEWRAASAKGAVPTPTPNNELDYQNA
jgi:hypothetical protein